MRASEDWARGLGCVEKASDALIDNQASQKAHQALGFAEVDRCVHFRKNLWRVEAGCGRPSRIEPAGFGNDL